MIRTRQANSDPLASCRHGNPLRQLQPLWCPASNRQRHTLCDLPILPEQPRTYHAQVEGEVTDDALRRLARGGVDLKDFRTMPCGATRLEIEPVHPPRCPPVRFRKTVATSWIELTLTEGKNRQVRRMSAAVGFPTLRLIRVRIGGLALDDLKIQPGQWRELSAAEAKQTLHER